MLFVYVLVWKSVKYFNLLYMFLLIPEAMTGLVLCLKNKTNKQTNSNAFVKEFFKDQLVKLLITL